MKLQYEDSGIIKESEISTFEEVKDSLNKIEPHAYPYLILVKENGDYIQCTGDKNKLTIEVRFFSTNSFKHFVMGKKEQNKIWATIASKTGPIRVLLHEVLNINDAVILFNEFYDNGVISNNFNKRNITKYFSS